MTYYYYNNIGPLTKDCMSRKIAQVPKLNHKGKIKVVDKEEDRKDFNKIWERKEDERKDAKSKEVRILPVVGETSMAN